ncbi:MAG: hypothetical protein LBI36_05665 [Oscillospiraceae bacterium]|jgi:hypothetical protein|nr:hypothetical protein [Oscillospiraceae bacterium]
MPETQTRLALLMDFLNISGKELAIFLKMDTGSFSKLRRGKRKLNRTSAYSGRIADYVLGKDFAAVQNELFAFLAKHGCRLGNVPSENRAEKLRLWLTARTPENKNAATVLGPYYGYDGWKSAMREFWESAKESGNARPVYAGDLGDVDWDLVEQQFILELTRDIGSVTRNSRPVIITTVATADYQSYVALMRWLPIYLNKRVEVRYVQEDFNTAFSTGIYIAEGNAAMINTGLRGRRECSQSLIYQDSRGQAFCAELLRELTKNSKRLFDHSLLSQPLAMIELMERHIRPEPLTFMINSLPSFLNMPLELLSEILDDNGVDGEKSALCLDANRRRRILRDRCNYFQIYDSAALEKALYAEYTVENDLSRVIGREVRITREQFRRQLEFIAKTRNTERYRLALVDFNDINLIAKGSAIVVQDDSVVFAWNSHISEMRIHCTELTVVGGFFNYLNDIWDKIPPIRKNDKWTDKQFARLLKN